MYAKYIKRILDFIISLISLIILMPLMIIIYILVLIKLGKPAIFKQKRPGKDERIFTLYKFRTMTNKKDEKGNLLPDSQRLTKFGKFLRATSLDELPELINILKGDMAIVGPRPLLVEYLECYNSEQKHRHDVKPGLTGLAQVSGRNSITWEEKFIKDIEYIKKITFIKDFKIILKTIKNVFNKEGINQEGNATMENFRDMVKNGEMNKMYNFLFCSAGRRVKLLENFKKTLDGRGKVIVCDNSIYAPTRYVADKAYTVPPIYDEDYIKHILDICKKEEIKVVLTLIDPEIELLSKNKDKFEAIGTTVLVPSECSSAICFDKYKMYNYLKENNIKTVLTYGTLEEFKKGYEQNKIKFPVFVKPRTGSGSVGAKKVNNISELEQSLNEDKSLIIQEYMNAEDLDADVYIDYISKKPVSMFTKKKIETKIGGASKTISFKDEKLFAIIKEILKFFEFSGAIDMDFFYKDGQYYLSEINPRFGGAYLHAYGAGVDFPELIINNIDGKENKENIGDFEEDIMMLMYDDVIIQKLDKE